MFPFIVLTIPFDLLCIFQHRLGKNESCSSLIQIRNVGAGAGGLYSEAPNKMSDMEVQRVTMYFETAGKKGKKKFMEADSKAIEGLFAMPWSLVLVIHFF